jgi:AcrR family transcriptional regulator
LPERLRAFYLSYLEVIDNHDRIRIAMLSGLFANELTKRYVERNVDKILIAIAVEVAAFTGDRAQETKGLTAEPSFPPSARSDPGARAAIHGDEGNASSPSSGMSRTLRRRAMKPATW